MPGKRITDHQVTKYKRFRKQFSQEAAAAKVGISVRSARRVEQRTQLPSQRALRHWRTRSDPLAGVWQSELKPLLQSAPGLTAVSLLEEMQRRYPGRFGPEILRTLQRRVRQWRALEGEEREVFFAQEHEPGRLGLSDFTDARELQVRVGGELLEHRLYQFALAYSGWRHVEVILGGESWVALSQGLQNALWALGGVPTEHRTDSLSAAFNNLSEREQLTGRYAELCERYGMRPTRNNRAASHENGAIEARQGSIKHFIEQALLLRASRQFDTLHDYRQFIAEVSARANARVLKALSVERGRLQALPKTRSSDYEELDARVSKFALISVKHVIYSVPSRLIGHRLKVRVFDAHIQAYLGEHCVLEAPRLRPCAGRLRPRVIDYRHMLPALKRKPGALVRWRLRDALFPRSEYAMTWQRLIEQLPERGAARIMIGLLDLAASHGCEAALGQRLGELIERNELPDLQRLSEEFAPRPLSLPAVAVTLPTLAAYDELVEARV
jgi:transcriptional regulator with XRE-family HTH domain